MHTLHWVTPTIPLYCKAHHRSGDPTPPVLMLAPSVIEHTLRYMILLPRATTTPTGVRPTLG